MFFNGLVWSVPPRWIRFERDSLLGLVNPVTAKGRAIVRTPRNSTLQAAPVPTLRRGRHSWPGRANLREFDLKLGKVFNKNSAGCIDRCLVMDRGAPADEDGDVYREKAP